MKTRALVLALSSATLVTPQLGWAGENALQSVPAESELVELTVRDVIPLREAQTHAVVLVSKDQTMVLPLFVDDASAVAIAFRLAHRTTPRPLSQDLLDQMVAQLGGTVTSVRIDDIHAHALSSHVYLRQGRREFNLGAKPADAVSMALAARAHIWATRTVLREAGIQKTEIDKLRTDAQLGTGGSGKPDIAL